MVRQVLYLFFIFDFIPSLMFGQSNRQANHWYFGYDAGLDFSSGKPEAVTHGVLATSEGSASISDNKGNLLFYTDGRSIWNRNHQLVPGANNLGGHDSSTQSALIIPQPSHPNLYYVFSVDALGGKGGIQYSVFDILLNKGLGGIVSKNNQLSIISSEKITVVKHCNKNDFWIITHELKNDLFKVFLLSSLGIDINPIVSKTGLLHNTAIGYMKSSPNGQKIAVGLADNSSFELFQFNNTTGTVSNQTLLKSSYFAGAYGLEFSYDNHFLYVSGRTKELQTPIIQLDITANTSAKILQSKIVIGTVNNKTIGALQLGPDKKIYIAFNMYDYLGVINNPSFKGVACEFIMDGISLLGRKSSAGLPNFPPFYFNIKSIPNIKQTTDKACNDVVLTANTDQKTASTLNYQWFADGKKVTDATKPSYKPTRSGSYCVSIKEADQCSNDSINSAPIDIKILDASPQFTNLGCNNVLLKANANAPVKWLGMSISSEKATQDTLTISGSNVQIYNLQIFHPDNAACYIQKELKVTFSSVGIYSFGKSTLTSCDTVTLNAPVSSKWDIYSWQQPDNSTIPSAKIIGNQSGQYIINVKNSQSKCEAKDTVSVTINKPPVIKQNESFCLINSSLILEAGAIGNGLTFNWSPSSSREPTLLVSKSGKYQVKATTAEGCSSSRTIEVFEAQKVTLGNDITVCEGEPLELSPTITNASASISYKWSTGETGKTIKPSASGIYKLTTKQFVCEISDSVRVTINSLPKIKPDETVCLNKEIEAGGLESGLTYYWQHSGQTTATIPVTEEGIYKVAISTPQGCTSTRTITINEPCVSRIYAPDVFTPNEDGHNDVFRLIIVSGQAIGLDVYNRWGEKIHKHEHTDPQWDGKLNGIVLPEGTYPYVFRYRIRNNDAVFEFRGTIALQR